MDQILSLSVPTPVKNITFDSQSPVGVLSRQSDSSKNGTMKDSRIVLFFETSKKSPRQPDISGKMMFKGTLTFVALWKTDSKYGSGVFWGGVVHQDREKTRKVGTMRIYKSKFYDANSKGPLMYGRLYHDNQVKKLYLWPKQGKNKAYLTGKLI